jgi:hypothetical protein
MTHVNIKTPYSLILRSILTEESCMKNLTPNILKILQAAWPSSVRHVHYYYWPAAICNLPSSHNHHVFIYYNDQMFHIEFVRMFTINCHATSEIIRSNSQEVITSCSSSPASSSVQGLGYIKPLTTSLISLFPWSSSVYILELVFVSFHLTSYLKDLSIFVYRPTSLFDVVLNLWVTLYFVRSPCCWIIFYTKDKRSVKGQHSGFCIKYSHCLTHQVGTTGAGPCLYEASLHCDGRADHTLLRLPSFTK